MPFDAVGFQEPEPQTLTELRATRALIARPEQWCCRELAVFPDGSISYALGEASDERLKIATRRCMIGAGATIVGQQNFWKSPLGVAFDHHGMNGSTNTTHAEVLALFDRAIAAELAKATVPA